MAERAAYADVIIDISHEQIDRPFQYRIPDRLIGAIPIGCQVLVPFGRGNSLRKAYVIRLSDTCTFDPDAVKEIQDISTDMAAAREQMIALAAWMRQEYGSTMIQALKTVLPVKETVRQVEQKRIVRCEDNHVFEAYVQLAEKKKWKGRLRLLEALKETGEIPWFLAQKQLEMTAAIIRPMEEAGVIRLDSQISYRDPLSGGCACQNQEKPLLSLNPQQQRIVDTILSEYEAGIRTPCLIHGITGSGKTEVYIRLIEGILSMGKSAIVLIPEISLTYQTVMRFYSRFGSCVSIVNSRLSQGERYDQFERAKRGEVRIMIGPRSALFTPFENLGLIIIDEEQESTYKSEQVPRYHARETAIERARLSDAVVVLGSATPSLEAYSRAKKGIYRLFTLTKRAVEGSSLAQVQVVDLRKEMEAGNRSIFSRALQQKMEECLEQKKQMILFLNRRGYSKAVSCRSCGQPVGCPHCAVPLTEHTGSRLVCHYCGYTIRIPKTCPSCGSPYLAGFGTGTQKIEMLVKERFPEARVLRMDYDTTNGKDGHEQILQAFSAHEADILVGTQMIVKGHDFPGVTLVGILAADMSLYNGDFRSRERTFQLLTQAAGRAGRGNDPGSVIIQTYDPENLSVRTAAMQDYCSFYEEEIRYRKMLAYPPEGSMCEVMTASESAEAAGRWIDKIALLINQSYHGTMTVIGPSDAPVARIRDFWRKHLFIKSNDHRSFLEALERISELEAELHKDKVYLSVTAL